MIRKLQPPQLLTCQGRLRVRPSGSAREEHGGSMSRARGSAQRQKRGPATVHFGSSFQRALQNSAAIPNPKASSLRRAGTRRPGTNHNATLKHALAWGWWRLRPFCAGKLQGLWPLRENQPIKVLDGSPGLLKEACAFVGLDVNWAQGSGVGPAYGSRRRQSGINNRALLSVSRFCFASRTNPPQAQTPP